MGIRTCANQTSAIVATQAFKALRTPQIMMEWCDNLAPATPPTIRYPWWWMTSLNVATVRRAYVYYNVNKAIPVADQNNVCVLPITNAHTNVRPLLLECCAEAVCVGVMSEETCLSSNTDFKRTTSYPGTRPAAEPATRLQHGGLVWALRCPHRVYDVEQRFKQTSR